jgi:hypothetical protein
VKNKHTPETTATTASRPAPPTWPSRSPVPGTFRDAPTVEAAKVYGAAVALGLDLPADLVGAVASLERALAVRADLSDRVAEAEAAWLGAVISHVEHGAERPPDDLLAALGSAVAMSRAAEPYTQRVAEIGERAQNEARVAVKVAGADLIGQAKVRHAALLADLQDAAAVVVGMATLADAARAQLAHPGNGMAPLDAWRQLEDAQHTYALLLDLRRGLSVLSRKRDEVDAIESRGWHEAQHLAAPLIPKGAEPPARLASLVAHAEQHGTWLPSDAELGAALDSLRTGAPRVSGPSVDARDVVALR